jgi:hypothetical protein
MNNAIDQDLLRLYAAYRKSDPDEPLDRNPHLAWDDVVREHRKICENGEIWRLTFMGWGRVDFPPIPHWGAWS